MPDLNSNDAIICEGKSLQYSRKNFLKEFEIFDCAVELLSVIENREGLAINICESGSVDLYWETKSARLLINVRKTDDKIMGHYYGDLYNDKDSIIGITPIEGDSKIIDWCNNNL